MWVLIEVLSKWVSTCFLPWGAKSCFFEHWALTVNFLSMPIETEVGQISSFVFICVLHTRKLSMSRFSRISLPLPPQPAMGITYFNMVLKRLLFLEGSVNSYSFFGFHTHKKKIHFLPNTFILLTAKLISNIGPFWLPENEKTANLVCKSSLWHVFRICYKMEFSYSFPSLWLLTVFLPLSSKYFVIILFIDSWQS